MPTCPLTHCVFWVGYLASCGSVSSSANEDQPISTLTRRVEEHLMKQVIIKKSIAMWKSHGILGDVF